MLITVFLNSSYVTDNSAYATDVNQVAIDLVSLLKGFYAKTGMQASLISSYLDTVLKTQYNQLFDFSFAYSYRTSLSTSSVNRTAEKWPLQQRRK